jgi:hypothetical protein
VLNNLLGIIDEEVKNTLEEYEKKGVPMIGTLPKGKGRVVEKEIPAYLKAGVASAMAMRLQAIELRKKADELEDLANNTLAPNMIVAEVKTITVEGLGQATYKEGRVNKPTYPVDKIKENALAQGFKAEDINQAFPEKVDPKAKFKELGYEDKKIKELWKSAEKPPIKEKGDPTVTFMCWENYVDKLTKTSKKEAEKGE